MDIDNSEEFKIQRWDRPTIVSVILTAALALGMLSVVVWVLV